MDKDYAVRVMYGYCIKDKEIAEVIGVGRTTVRDMRERMGLGTLRYRKQCRDCRRLFATVLAHQVRCHECASISKQAFVARKQLLCSIWDMYRRDPEEARELIREIEEEDPDVLDGIRHLIGDDATRPGHGYQFMVENGPLYGWEIKDRNIRQAVKKESANKMFWVNRFMVGEHWLFFVEGQEDEAYEKLGEYEGELHMMFRDEFMSNEEDEVGGVD